MSLDTVCDINGFGFYWNSVYESDPVFDRIGVPLGTYLSPEQLIATVEDLLSSEFSLHAHALSDQSVSLFQSLIQLKNKKIVKADNEDTIKASAGL